MVSQWTWKHGQQPENDYVFSYDGVGRMVAAKHFVDGARTDGYTERGIRYDANGNLLSISRTAGGAVSDSLRFTLGGRRAVGRLRDLDGRVRVRSERKFGERRAESFGIQL